MYRSTFGRILFIAVILFVMAACSKTSAIEVGDQAPEFTLKDVDGNIVKLQDLSGKGIILNFFASWCPPCRQEIPDFIELQKNYEGRGFTFIGVSLEKERETKDFVDRIGINYPVLIDDGRVSVLYGPIRSIPTTFIIGKDSKIVKMYIGSRSKDTFENDIKEILK